MALTRAMLKGMNLGGEQIEAIIGAHGETVQGLKNEILLAQSRAESLPQIQKELDEARQELQMLQEDPWQARYAELSAQFDSFRQDVTQKELRQAKESAYRTLLLDAGISEKRIGAVLRVSDYEALPWEDGAFCEPEKILQDIRQEWGEFVGTMKVHGTNVHHPPLGGMRETEMGKLPMREYIRRRSAKKTG